MPIITNSRFLVVFALILCLGAFLKKYRKEALIIVLAVIISDGVSARLLKPVFKRVRPCHALEQVKQRVDVARSYSFPSSHAANAFAFCTAWVYFFRRYGWAVILFACTVSFSRIYVGVHYPFDVLSGAATGILCSFIVITGYKKLKYNISNNSENIQT